VSPFPVIKRFDEFLPSVVVVRLEEARPRVAVRLGLDRSHQCVPGTGHSPGWSTYL
jgi:hypothetical protein